MRRLPHESRDMRPPHRLPRQEGILRRQAVVRCENPESLPGKRCRIGAMCSSRTAKVTSAVQVHEDARHRSRLRLDAFRGDAGKGSLRDLDIRGSFYPAAIHDGARMPSVLRARESGLEGMPQRETHEMGLPACHRAIFRTSRGTKRPTLKYDFDGY